MSGRYVAVIGATAIGLVLTLWFLKPILRIVWWMLEGIFSIMGIMLTIIVHMLIFIALLIPGWAITAAINILAALVPIAAAFIVIMSIWGVLLISVRQFAMLASKMDFLSMEGKQAAIDAGFLAALAAGSAIVAYTATDDFLDHFHTLKFLAVASLVCSIGKISLLAPARAAKWLGVALTALAIAATSFYLSHHFRNINWQGIEMTRVFAFTVIIGLFATAAAYPFTFRGWRELLSRAAPAPSGQILST